MKLTKIFMIAVFVLSIAAPAYSEGELSLLGDKLSIDVTADYFGKYIWRGQNLSDDPVFQTGVSASYKGFSR